MIDDAAYARAVLRHADSVLQMFAGERLINKIFARVFQCHAMGRLVIAHFDARAGAAPPPTLAHLQALTGCSRTLAAFVGVSKVARLISAHTDPTDRRQRILVPGPRVIEGLRQWLGHHLSLAEELQMMPAGLAAQLKSNEPYFERFVRASTIVIDGVRDIRNQFDHWDWFEQHECGQRMAYALLKAHYNACLSGGHPIDAPQDLDLTGADVARLLGLSKSHVRNVFNGAEQLGILHQDETRRKLRLTMAFLLQARDSFQQLMLLLVRTHQHAETLQA